MKRFIYQNNLREKLTHFNRVEKPITQEQREQVKKFMDIDIMTESNMQSISPFAGTLYKWVQLVLTGVEERGNSIHDLQKEVI